MPTPVAAPLEFIDLAQETRSALRRLARSVAIVTSRDEIGRYAVTVTAVNEVSLDPPTMLVCVNRSSSIYPALGKGADFCINILHRTHQELSSACAGRAKGEDRFLTADWGASAQGVPRLVGAQASLVCRQVKMAELGSHGVFFGEVQQAIVGEDIDPLIYVDGRYDALASTAGGRVLG